MLNCNRKILIFSLPPLSNNTEDEKVENNTSNSYTKIKSLSNNERGKNQSACLVFSHSRANYLTKKQWIFKPLFFVNEKLCYTLAHATRDVFFARLEVEIRGKQQAAKAKFNHITRGIVSRVLGDDFSQTKDMFLSCVYSGLKKLPPDAEQSFLESLVFSLLIENRDIKIENMILQTSTNSSGVKKYIVYGIDREFAGCNFQNRIPFNEMLHIVLSDPKKIIDVFINHKCHWNVIPIGQKLSAGEIEGIENFFAGFITKDMLVETLNSVIKKLSNGNFRAFCEAKYKVLIQISEMGSLYTDDEISSTVLPTIEGVINVVKNNIARAQEVLGSLVASDNSITIRLA